MSQSPSTIPSIAEASYAQIVALRESMRRRVQSEPSLEEASQAFVQKLYDELGGSAALVRMYVTLPASRLPPVERKFAEEVCAAKSPGLRLEPSTRVLTLLGTYGSEMAWCDRKRSAGHLAIPLIDASFVEGLPMIARLLAELGVDVAHIEDDAIFARRLIGGFIGVFHVAEAADAVDSRGRHIIPATDFVKAHGIRTVFGMGGAFLDGNIASCIVFARETFSRTQAERFASLISNFKLLTGPLLREGHFFRAAR